MVQLSKRYYVSDPDDLSTTRPTAAHRAYGITAGNQTMIIVDVGTLKLIRH